MSKQLNPLPSEAAKPKARPATTCCREMLVLSIQRQVATMRRVADATERDNQTEPDIERRRFYEGRIYCLREQAANLEVIIRNCGCVNKS